MERIKTWAYATGKSGEKRLILEMDGSDFDVFSEANETLARKTGNLVDPLRQNPTSLVTRIFTSRASSAARLSDIAK